MTTSRRERKKEQNRKALISSAMSLFRERGYPATSIDEIIEKADVSKATLYNYFPDKGAIVVAYFQNRIAEFGSQYRATMLERHGIEARLGFLLDAIYQLLADELELAGLYFAYRLKDLLVDNTLDHSKRSGVEALLLEVVETAQQRQEIRSDMPAALVVRNLQVLLMSCLASELPGDEPFATNPLKAQLIDLFLHGAAAASTQGA